MRVQAFETLIRSGSSALRVLRRKRDTTGRLIGHACASHNVYRLSSGRYRGGRCRYTFGVFTGTGVGQARIPLTTWLWLVKWFELAVTARQAAIQTGVSYPTALNVFTTIRRALLAPEHPEWLQGEVEADESYCGGRRKGTRGRGAVGNVPVFAILERRGCVSVTVVPNVTAQTAAAGDDQDRQTDKFRGYDTLAFCGYRRLAVTHNTRFTRGKVHINGLEGFWRDAKGKLLQHHGISPEKFPLDLYERQFRYTHRHEDLFQ